MSSAKQPSSLSLPSLPFALIGGFWLIYLLGHNLSVASTVGFIALAGVAAEFGVVTLLYLDQAVARHQRENRLMSQADLMDAIMEGAVLRVRPKAMTVVVIIAGLLPLFWGAGAYDWRHDHGAPAVPVRDSRGLSAAAQAQAAEPMNGLFGLPVLGEGVPVSPVALRLVSSGIAALWSRIVAADPLADSRPLLLSYDVHPTPQGPVLIEVNTNAGGALAAMQAAREVNECCGAWEQRQLEARLLALFRRDLLGADPQRAGVVAIVDDQLSTQPLLTEMQALAALMRPFARDVRVVDAAELEFSDGRLRHGDTPIDRVYWRSTDFLLTEPRHEAVRKALEAGAITLAPSPEAYRAIADKRRFVEWSQTPELAHDAASGLSFRIAETVPMGTRTPEAWYAERDEWVFKPVSGYASRGVYVGKSISRRKLAELPTSDYLAQRYAPHPVIDRNGQEWKYDVRFFADRGQIIGAAARVFQGQVVGMRMPGSGFAPIRVDAACCLIGALGAAAGNIEKELLSPALALGTARARTP